MHKYELLKKICSSYCTLRLKHLAKEMNQNVKKNGLRQKLSKLVLLQNQ